MLEEKRLLSLRGEDQLLRLHRQSSKDARELDQLVTRFVAALQACDRVTQQQYFGEYLRGLIAVRQSQERIAAFVEGKFDIRIDEESWDGERQLP